MRPLREAAARRPRMIFSRHSRLHFCRSFTECDRRLARAKRKNLEGSPASSLPAGEGATDPGAGIPTEPTVFTDPLDTVGSPLYLAPLTS